MKGHIRFLKRRETKRLYRQCLAILSSGALGLFIATGVPAFALPEGGQVVNGQASVSVAGSQLNINQSSQSAIINWNSFSIGGQETVTVTQPGASSVLLNRVLGNDPSQIFGTLKADGQVFLVNPNGVLFSQTARVDVGGLVASSLAISDQDFLSGRLSFESAGSPGSVVNQGRVHAGFVALMGGSVDNSGVIVTRAGSTALAAGRAVSLAFSPDGLLSVSVEKEAYDAQVRNSGLIEAEGGRVIMTAKAADALLGTVVNTSGIVRATGISERNGEIIIDGGPQGQVQVGGTLDVSSSAGTGGSVTVLGSQLTLLNSTLIEASGLAGGGTVLVGGGFQGGDAQLHNSQTLTMDAAAIIRADALETGSGGTVVLWADGTTDFQGSISARGGSLSGSGGVVETSGKAFLRVTGQVDAAAVSGTAGTWLMDPRNVTIGDVEEGVLVGGVYTPSADDANVSVTTIQTALNAGTNVTINTGTDGAQDGNITVASALTRTASGYATLTLQAANDIIVNAPISSSSGRLNVVLTADADGSSAGSVTIGGTGSVTTNGGNFYVGSVSGATDVVAAKGVDFTIANGGFVDVASGILAVNVSGAISLSANSLKAVANTYPRYNNNNYKYYNNELSLTGASITSTNMDLAVPDIYGTAMITTFNSNLIGQVGNPIKISGGASSSDNSLYLNNTSGSSYVSQIVNKAFSVINVTQGAGGANTTQNLQILNDNGGDGSTGQGHIILNKDASGILRLESKNIDTSATSTSVYLTPGTDVSVADGAVNAGSVIFSLSLGSNTLQSKEGDNLNGTSEITARSIYLSGKHIGTLTHALELKYGSMLQLSNTGGSDHVRFLDDTQFGDLRVHLTNQDGIHSLLFPNGDHLDVSTSAAGVTVETITTRSTGIFDAQDGIDMTGNPIQRSVLLSVLSGDLLFQSNSVNMGAGAFTGETEYTNNAGNIRSTVLFADVPDAPEITAGNVTFRNRASGGTGLIGGGGYDLKVAQGAGTSNNVLTVSSYTGSATVHELTENHFKTIQAEMLGGHQANQTFNIDLKGDDRVMLVDDGSEVVLDASNVDLDSNNRSFQFSTSSRTVKIDGVSVGSGSYTVQGTPLLKLNADVTTDGGNITFSASNISLLKSVRLDTNTDNSGASGMFSISGIVSATAPGFTLAIDTSSADGSGGLIYHYSSSSNETGQYLAGLSLDSRGGASDGTTDGSIIIYYSQYLDGAFSAYGNTNCSASLIDTEQGNNGSGGSITFGGRNLYLPLGNFVFDTSTTAAGYNGGDILLAGTQLQSTLNTGSLNLKADAGAGGQAGIISLPSVNTSNVHQGYLGAQTYSGRQIDLHGDLTSDRGGNISFSGNVVLHSDVTIDTWNPTYNIAGSYVVPTGTAGSVTFSSGTVSAAVSGASLTVDTSTSTLTNYSNPPTDTANFTQNGGAVSLSASSAGGFALDSLTVKTRASGDHNVGTGGTIALTNVAVEGAITLTGGGVSLAGTISTNGGAIDMSVTSGITLPVGTLTIDTDRLGGSGNAGTLNLGHVLNSPSGGQTSLVIDLSADGGGAAAPLTIGEFGYTRALNTLKIIAGPLTVQGWPGTSVKVTNQVLLEARGAESDLTLVNLPILSQQKTVTLVAGRNFINNNPTGSGIETLNSRYFVYSTAPAGSLEGMTGYSKHYNQTYTEGVVPSYATSGNWFFYSVAPVITATTTVSNITYGSADPVLTTTYSGYIDGDSAASVSGEPVYAYETFTATGSGRRPVGSYDVLLSGSLTDGLGYSYSGSSYSMDVSAKAISTTGATADSRTYNGTLLATISGAVLDGNLAGDLVSLTGGGSFADKNVGITKAVTSSLSLTGADAGNYTLTQPVGLTADISALALTVNGSVVVDKVYDGTTAATISGSSLVGVVLGDTVTLGGSGSYSDKNVGSGKAVTALLSLSGADASNYTLTQPVGLTGSISARALSVTGVYVQDREYDGGVFADVAWSGTSGLIDGDLVNITGDGAFSDKNVGIGKSVLATIQISGADADNYLFTQPTGVTGDITAKQLTVSGASVQDKVYDGTTQAAIIGGSLLGIVAGDTVLLGGDGAFADRNVGTGKAVSAALAISGSDAGNYTLAQPTSLTGNITARALTVTGAVVANKTYDGTTSAEITGAGLTGVVAGDVVVLQGNGRFQDKNVGVAKAVTAVLDLSGTDAGNYVLTQPVGLTADITARALSIVGASVRSKIYDGTTTAVLASTGALSGVLAGDEGRVALQGGSAHFTDRNAGMNKSVTVTGYKLSGDEASNYVLSDSTISLSGDILRRVVDITATPQKKMEGALDPELSYVVSPGGADSGLVAGESLTGALTRQPGEIMGTYPILQGGITEENNPNYAIHFLGADFTIESALTPQIPIPTPPVQPVFSPGAPIAPPTANIIVSGSLGGASTIQGGVPGPFAGFAEARIPAPFAAPGGTVFVALPPDLFVHRDPQATVQLSITQANGAPLPSWLSFDPRTRLLSGKAPAGAPEVLHLTIIARDQDGEEARSQVTIQLTEVN